MRNTCRSTWWPLQNRLKVQHDSIDYFPPTVNRGGRIGFFSDLGTRTRAYDQVELSQQVASVGRVFFKIPGGIKYGQHFLNVQFKESLVRVPFRILTAEEEKFLTKNYRDIREQVQEAFEEVERSAIAGEQDRDLVGPGRERNFDRAGC